MKQVRLLRLEVQKMCHQFLAMFPLSLFLFLVSEHFPYLLLVLLVLLASVPVLLDSLHPVFLVFLHLDSPAVLGVLAFDLGSPAVPASDLDSPVALASDLGFPAVPASDLDSPVALASDLGSLAVLASDLDSLASAPVLAVLHCIPSDLLLDYVQSRYE